MSDKPQWFNELMKGNKPEWFNDEIVDLEMYQQKDNTITLSNGETSITSNIWFDVSEIR